MHRQRGGGGGESDALIQGQVLVTNDREKITLKTAR